MCYSPACNFWACICRVIDQKWKPAIKIQVIIASENDWSLIRHVRTMNQSVASGSHIYNTFVKAGVYIYVVVNDRSSIMSFLTSHMYNCLCTQLYNFWKRSWNIFVAEARGASFMVGPYERTARFLNQSAGAS